MKDMMKEMMREMMGTMMKELMAEMMSEMMGVTKEPTVVPAEVEAPKRPKTLSRNEFLALAEDVKEVTAPKDLDFVVYGKTAVYTGYVPSDIWTVNHLAITKDYGGRWSKKNGGYIFESTTALRNFLNSYKIKTELDDTDRNNVKAYKAERNKAKAEYYAKLAGK